MKQLNFVILSVAILFSACGVNHKTSKNSMDDDRLCECPLLDKMLGDIVANCKQESLRSLRRLKSDEDIDTSCYYMTLNLYTKDDTVKIEAMGEYDYPIVCHDSLSREMDHFIGHFKRENVNWLLYECLYNELPTRKKHLPCTALVSIFRENWRLQKNPIEHPEFFRRDISGTIMDPYIFEYMVDSVGNVQLLRKGHW